VREAEVRKLYRNGRPLAPAIRVPKEEMRWAVMCAYAMKRGNVLTRTAKGIIGACDRCGRERLVDLVNVSSEIDSDGIFRLADLIIYGFPDTFGLWCRSCRAHAPNAIKLRREKDARARRAAAKRPKPVSTAKGQTAEEAAAWAREVIARANASPRPAPGERVEPPGAVGESAPAPTAPAGDGMFAFGIADVDPWYDVRSIYRERRVPRIGWIVTFEDGRRAQVRDAGASPPTKEAAACAA
jgi:hypothetical protein